eukprot:6085490-Pleurochrysis_carterae.AAC.1
MAPVEGPLLFHEHPRCVFSSSKAPQASAMCQSLIVKAILDLTHVDLAQHRSSNSFINFDRLICHVRPYSVPAAARYHKIRPDMPMASFNVGVGLEQHARRCLVTVFAYPHKTCCAVLSLALTLA